jgi:hypothetical protein
LEQPLEYKSMNDMSAESVLYPVGF